MSIKFYKISKRRGHDSNESCPFYNGICFYKILFGSEQLQIINLVSNLSLNVAVIVNLICINYTIFNIMDKKVKRK